METNTVSKKQGFVQRYGRVITFLGALIVFSTFVVKEGIREQLRSTSESVNTAQSIFLVRSDMNELSIYMAYLNTRIGALNSGGTSSNSKITGPTLSTMRDNVDLMLANRQRAGASRDNLARMFAKLEFKENTKSKLDLVNSKVEELNAKADVVNSRAIELNNSRSEDVSKINWIILKATEVSAGYTSNRFDTVEPLQKEMIDAAERRSKKYEHLYSQATRLSYVLYALGWGLGLLGRIYGVETGDLA